MGAYRFYHKFITARSPSPEKASELEMLLNDDDNFDYLVCSVNDGKVTWCANENVQWLLKLIYGKSLPELPEVNGYILRTYSQVTDPIEYDKEQEGNLNDYIQLHIRLQELH